MDLELKWRDLTWFEVLGRATATHEEALETAIPEYCPDMNRIVDATGQLQIRDREITGGAVMVSGMVSVRVLYSSEESSGLRSLEVSVPFRCTQEGGNLAACRVLRAEGRLLLTEAKAVSARRLYVRVLPEVTVTGYGEMHGRLCCAAEGDASLAGAAAAATLRGGGEAVPVYAGDNAPDRAGDARGGAGRPPDPARDGLAERRNEAARQGGSAALRALPRRAAGALHP